MPEELIALEKELHASHAANAGEDDPHRYLEGNVDAVRDHLTREYEELSEADSKITDVAIMLESRVRDFKTKPYREAEAWLNAQWPGILRVIEDGQYSPDRARLAMQAAVELEKALLEATECDWPQAGAELMLHFPGRYLYEEHHERKVEEPGTPFDHMLQLLDRDYDASYMTGRLLDKAYEHVGGIFSDIAKRDTWVQEYLNKHGGDYRLHEELIPELPDRELAYNDRVQFNARVCEHTTAMLKCIDVPEAMIIEFLSSEAVRQTLPPNQGADKPDHGGLINPAEFKDKVEDFIERAKAIGVENVKKLHQQLAVENLACYSVEQLKDLVKLVDEDPEFIEYLQQGDVVVVFMDARGDHNGAIVDDTQKLQQQDRRVLQFEIISFDMIQKRMDLLKSLGIRPSTIVISAHGAPGVVSYGGGVNTGFDLLSDFVSKEMADPDNYGVNIMKSELSKVVSDEYMQAGKGVDCDEELIGRKQLLILSCSADKEDGEDSTRSTFASDLVKTLANEGVDVYAGWNDIYLNQEPDGSLFLGNADLHDLHHISRPAQNRLRYYKDKRGRGQVSRQVVARVPYRRPKSEKVIYPSNRGVVA